MTVASYATDLTLLDAAESITGWAESTDSNWDSIDRPVNDTDDFIQNIKCNSAAAKTGVGVLLYNYGTGITLNQDDAVLIWCKWDAAPLLAVESSGGIRTVIGNALNAFNSFDQLGSDSYPYGGWRNLATGDPADSEVTPDDVVNSPTTTKQYFGWAFNAPGDVPGKGNPYKVDVIRYGRCEISVINGDATAYGTFTGMAQENDYNDGTNGYNRWGLFQAIDGGYLWKGLMSIGTTTVVDFRDSNVTITIDDTKHCTKNFNKIEINNASSRVDWTGITFNSLGVKSPGRFEVVDNADVNIDLCTFNDMDTFIFQSNSGVLNSTFNRCGQVTHAGATMNGSFIGGYEGTVDTSALIYNVAADPNGEMDNMAFTKGSAATHAIEFGTSSPLDITLTGIDFSGYNASDEQTDSTFHIKRTSGAETVTINIVGGSGDISYKSDGAIVSIVQNPVALTVTAKDSDTKVAIEGAAVTVLAATGGPFPFEDTVTITSSAGTAIVAHTAHGLKTGNKVEIKGANENEYNRIKTITVTGDDEYTYPVSGTPDSPATGTIISTAVIIDGETNASGVVTDTRTYSSNQPVAGNVRKGTHEPVYVPAPISDTIDKDAGLSITALMILD